MKEPKLSSLAKAYLERIERSTTRGEIESVRIDFSNDCSGYRLDWDEFLVLYRAQQARRAVIRGEAR